MLRRSSRIASLQAKQQEESVVISEPPKVKRVQIIKNNIQPKESSFSSSSSSSSNVSVQPEKYKIPDFVDLRWIQQFRYELSEISNDPLEASEHLKVLSEMILNFPFTYGGLDDWFADVLSHCLCIQREPEDEDQFNFLRGSIELCYTSLMEIEDKLSSEKEKEEHPREYYYPPLVRSKKCKERMGYMDKRIKEFFGFCKKLGIKCIFNIAKDECGGTNVMIGYNRFNNYLFSVTEFSEEGHFIRKVYGSLEQSLCDKIVESFGKEYCYWDGKHKYKNMDNVEIVIH